MDDYSILGLQPGATWEEIKAAYRNEIKKYHPDAINNTTENTNQMTVKINEAYENLKSKMQNPPEELKIQIFKIEEKIVQERKELVKIESNYQPLCEVFNRLNRKQKEYRLSIENSLSLLIAVTNTYYSNQIYDINQSKLKKLKEKQKIKLKERKQELNNFLEKELKQIENYFFDDQDLEVFNIKIPENITLLLNKIVPKEYNLFLNTIKKYYNNFFSLIKEIEICQTKIAEYEVALEKIKLNLQSLQDQKNEIIQRLELLHPEYFFNANPRKAS